MLPWGWNMKGHLVCRKDFGDEDRKMDAPCGMLRFSSLDNHITDDCREIYLGPLKYVVNEVGHLESEIVSMGHRDEIVG